MVSDFKTTWEKKKRGNPSGDYDALGIKGALSVGRGGELR